MPSQGVDVLKTGLLATSSFLLVLFLSGLTQGSAQNNDRLSRSLQSSLPSYNAVDNRHNNSKSFRSATHSKSEFKYSGQKPSWTLIGVDKEQFHSFLKQQKLDDSTIPTPWFFSIITIGKNKLNGWKESNILYTRKLTYHA